MGLESILVRAEERFLEDPSSCWSCGYSLIGLDPATVRCPECGSDQRDDGVERRRARFIAAARPRVRRSIEWAAIAFLASTALLVFVAGVTGDSGVWLGVVSIGAPVAIVAALGMGAVLTARASRIAALLCLGLALPFGSVPMSLGLALSHAMGDLQTILVLAGLIVGLTAFMARWNLLADRAALPEVQRTGWMASALVAACVVVGFSPLPAALVLSMVI